MRQLLSLRNLTLTVALAAGLVTRWQFAHEHPIGEDDLQHMHFAWCINQGLVPYRDFWDNHPPALHHLVLKHVIRPDAPPSESLIAARRWMVFLGLPTLAATWLLARRLFDRQTAWWALVWLTCCEIYLVKTVEIRADGLMAAAITLALYACASAAMARSPRAARARCFAAGLLFGAAFTLSTKAAIPLATAALAAAALLPRLRRFSIPWSAITANAALCALGLALPVATWLLFESRHGAAWSALRYTLIDNLSDPDRLPFWRGLANVWPWAFFSAALAGAAALIWRAPRGALRRLSAAWLAASACGAASVYAGVMPAPFAQSAMMFVPVFAVLAGFFTARLAALRTTARVALAACALLAVVHPLVRVQLRRPAAQLAMQAILDRIDWAHQWTSADDVVFDGVCLAVFRRHAASRPSLVGGALKGYWNGTAGPLRDELRRSGCSVVFRDARVRGIPPEDMEFLKAHYVQARQVDQSLHLPGARFEAAEVEGEGVEFEVIFGGEYRIRRESVESETTIDGNRVETTVVLGAGRYRLASRGRASGLTIWRAPGQAVAR